VTKFPKYLLVIGVKSKIGNKLKLHFDSKQEYQIKPVDSVVKLFLGRKYKQKEILVSENSVVFVTGKSKKKV
jgi:hypothetical protein